MSSIKLSICIPTYKRAEFLRKLLSHLQSDLNLPFAYEIVISDNASPDNTQSVAEEFIASDPRIRYFKRPINEGGWPNLTNAFMHAKGEYAMYVADDDLLIPEGLAAAIAFMEANPEVVACYAPWLLHDEVAGRDTGQFYHVKQNTTFGHRDFAKLFRFIFDGHVFPEIAIYRTETLRSAYVPREFCFWAFSHLAHFVDTGPVAFLPRSFYRSVTRSKIEREGIQAGHDETATAWDRYRGGLEYFLYVGAKRGRLDLSGDNASRYEQMCKIFMLNRMAVALRFWMARGDFIKAYELYTRLMWGGLGQNEDVKRAREKLPLLVAVQTFARQVNTAVGVKRIMLCDVTDAVALDGLLHEVGLKPEIEVVQEASLTSADDRLSTVIFTASAKRRPEFIAAGYLPNMVFCEDDLTDKVII